MRNVISKLLAAGSVGVLSACVAPPASEMESQARKAAAAEYVAKNCGAYVGGFLSARELRAESNRNITTARKLGATDADIQKARTDVAAAFSGAEIFTSRQEACNQLMSQLAWEMG